MAGTITLTTDGGTGGNPLSLSIDAGALTLAGQSLTAEIAEPLYALDFPSNGDSPSDAFVALQFANPHSNGLPIWGPSDAGVTYIWRYRPVQQTGYYVTFWWSNNGSFLWDGGGSNSYYGCHPYPTTGNSSGTSHYWELAGMASGNDSVNTLSGSPLTVVKDEWYTQALRITVNGDGTKTGRFYIDLPSTANGNIIQTTATSGWGETNPPSPAVTFGDSPWYASFGHERMSGQLGQVKIFSSVLSEADMLDEAADMSQLVTAAGEAAIWWGKAGFADVDDLTCDYGTARSFAWANSNKAALGDAL